MDCMINTAIRHGQIKATTLTRAMESMTPMEIAITRMEPATALVTILEIAVMATRNITLMIKRWLASNMLTITTVMAAIMDFTTITATPVRKRMLIMDTTSMDN